MSDLLRTSLISDTLPHQFNLTSLVIGLNLKLLVSSVGVILALFIVGLIIKRRVFNKYKIIPVKVILGKDAKIECMIERNEENVFIAHRIYIELVTRKAALEIDPEHDMIVEIYDSWYKLFGIIRDEIKEVPGRYLLNIATTSQLTKLTIDILNKGLRPHLTEYQAEFRKWYSEELKKDNASAPQLTQRQYPRYKELIADMVKVNAVLKSYAEQLREIFSNDK
ncbi:MAG: hypothetical protein JNL74_00275 [Fibrobacteres bacterium]|nr:hypothetical protein [Fibrobacterota bacterium]